MDITAWIVVCMLACIGIGVMVGDLLFVRRSRRLDKCNYRIITLYDDPVEVERLLNQHLVRLTWNGPDGLILLVDMGMGPESRKICDRIRSEMYGAFLCDKTDIAQTLRHLDSLLDDTTK
ncbi:hypothetical protein LJC63_07170 [Ruminococcaceae bacterium OttesenSCG-928-L11]|nr:hypothetical protein [Ruminococcaceae bacterium OttesenSCG-928-L11]